MPTDDVVDFYRLDDLLKGEEKKIRERVSVFVDQECMPVIAEHFDKGTFPMKLIPRFADLGLFGVHVEAYGCREKSHTVYGLICTRVRGRGRGRVKGVE